MGCIWFFRPWLLNTGSTCIVSRKPVRSVFVRVDYDPIIQIGLGALAQQNNNKAVRW